MMTRVCVCALSLNLFANVAIEELADLVETEIEHGASDDRMNHLGSESLGEHPRTVLLEHIPNALQRAALPPHDNHLHAVHDHHGDGRAEYRGLNHVHGLILFEVVQAESLHHLVDIELVESHADAVHAQQIYHVRSCSSVEPAP